MKGPIPADVLRVTPHRGPLSILVWQCEPKGAIPAPCTNPAMVSLADELVVGMQHNC